MSIVRKLFCLSLGLGFTKGNLQRVLEAASINIERNDYLNMYKQAYAKHSRMRSTEDMKIETHTKSDSPP